MRAPPPLPATKHLLTCGTWRVIVLCFATRRRSVAVEGYGGLWKGVSAAMWRAIPVNAAIFLAVEGTRQVIADTEDSVDALVEKLSGKGEAAL